MTDHHSSHSQSHKSGFCVESGGGFVSLYGSEGKRQDGKMKKVLNIKALLSMEKILPSPVRKKM
ncbi:hypothetical protein ABID23_001390 [Bartonella silvatica]|uniref:Uncharacterized protein n=1 Tax=Bartonella silvatica TaxID=357760 RepID=A0ABV2HIC7_9HYPH